MVIMNSAAEASLVALGLLDKGEKDEFADWAERNPRRLLLRRGEDKTALHIGVEIAKIVGRSLGPEPWTLFAWKTIADDFGLLSSDSDPWPELPVESADMVDVWLRSVAKTELYHSLAKGLGGRIVQFSGVGVHIALCTPISNYRPDWAWVTSRDQTATMCGRMGITLATHTAFGGSHVGKAREKLLWDAMASPATHILFVDDDMGWDPRILGRLLAADMDFVAAVGCKKQEQFGVCCNFLTNPQCFDERSGFLEVQDVGFAFVLLKREVIERVANAYPELEYRTTNGRREWALFFDLIDDGDRLSEDFSFCRRWRKIGGRIFIDQDASLKHIGRKEFSGAPAQLLEVRPRVAA